MAIPSDAPTAPRNVLVKANNWLGDVVMSIPTLRALRRAWPRATLGLMIRRELASLFSGSDWIDTVIAYDHPTGRLERVRRLLAISRTIRGGGYDLGLLLPNRGEPALWLYLAGVPRRVGFDLHSRGPLLTDRVPYPADPPRHQVYDGLELVRRAFGITGDAEDLAIDVPAGARGRVRAWLDRGPREPARPLVALAPTAAYGPAKEWPAERFAELVDRLSARGFETVLVGSGSERLRAEEIAARSRSGSRVVAGETSVADLAALLSLCDAFVGNDSGAMHLAAALGVATVGIFGSTDPRRTSPRGVKTRVLSEPRECSPCLARTCRFGHKACFDPIGVDAVLRALDELGAGPRQRA